MAFVDLWENEEEKMSCTLAKDLDSFRAIPPILYSLGSQRIPEFLHEDKRLRLTENRKLRSLSENCQYHLYGELCCFDFNEKAKESKPAGYKFNL